MSSKKIHDPCFDWTRALKILAMDITKAGDDLDELRHLVRSGYELARDLDVARAEAERQSHEILNASPDARLERMIAILARAEVIWDRLQIGDITLEGAKVTSIPGDPAPWAVTNELAQLQLAHGALERRYEAITGDFQKAIYEIEELKAKIGGERAYEGGKLAALEEEIQRLGRERNSHLNRIQETEAAHRAAERQVNGLETRLEIAEKNQRTAEKRAAEHARANRTLRHRLEAIEAETSEQRAARIERYERERAHAAEENVLAEEAADRAISGGGSLGTYAMDEIDGPAYQEAAERMVPRRAPGATTGHERAPQRGDVEIDGFVAAMKAKLRENDHKGGWQDETACELAERLVEEVIELLVELGITDHCREQLEGVAIRFDSEYRRGVDRDEVRAEAADVGNFAMMIWDRHG